MEMPVKTQVKLDKFKPRPYQLEICRAFEEKKFKKMIIVLPRRAGKDIVCFNLLVRSAFKRIGTYYYLLPAELEVSLFLV